MNSIHVDEFFHRKYLFSSGMQSGLFFCNREDFVEVADLVLQNTPEADIKAVSRLAHWKCSLPNIPAPVICTHALLVIKSFNVTRTNDYAMTSAASPTSYIAEEFHNMAYASAVSRSVSLLLEDNEDLRGLSMKAMANAMGMPEWLTDVRNDIAHGRRILSIDFLSSVVDKILAWLRESFWSDLLHRYSSFVKTGGQGSPLWLQLEELLVLYEQQTFRALTFEASSLRITATRRRVQVVRQLGSIAKLDLPEFCRCFVRSGYMFPTLDQLKFLGVEDQILEQWKSSQQPVSITHNSLNKRVTNAFLKTRKFWKLLIFHLFNSIDASLPALIESIVKSCPPNPTVFEKQIRLNCWITYLIDKYVTTKPQLGVEILERCASAPSPLSLATLRRLSFIDWTRRNEAAKCTKLIELMSAYVGETSSPVVIELDPLTNVSKPRTDEIAPIFTASDARCLIEERLNKEKMIQE